MRRREFIGLCAGVAAWPFVARSQQVNRTRIVGVLMASSENDSISQAHLAAFRNALQELGWSEGRNVRFEVRWSAGEIERVRALAPELVKLAPDVILAPTTIAIAALKQATRSIPLVFVIVNDPVAQGLVPSVAHPGGNITGFSYMDYSVLEKGLQLLKGIAPTINRVGFMFNPETYPYYEVYLQYPGGRQIEARGWDLQSGRLQLRQGAQRLHLPGRQGSHHDWQGGHRWGDTVLPGHDTRLP
jgi:putative tryptophan/tyrosine transport system substrate-binding protein